MSVVDKILAHIAAGVFDDRLYDLSRAVSTRTFEVDREAARLREQAQLEEFAAEVDVLVRDLLILHSQNKFDVKMTATAIELYKNARRIGRDDLVRKIGTAVFNLSEEQIP